MHSPAAPENWIAIYDLPAIRVNNDPKRAAEYKEQRQILVYRKFLISIFLGELSDLH
jgi:hypothetical protein